MPRSIARTRVRRIIAASAVAAIAAAQAGCLYRPTPNPDIAMTTGESRVEWRRLRAEPLPLQRPVVVLNGYRGLPIRGINLGNDLARLTSQNRRDFLILSYPFASDIPSVARRVVDAVERRWPSETPGQTIEVDVVGFSMGGLVARYAALPCPESGLDRTLAARRLFTLATPHRGARAAIIPIDRAIAQMSPGAVFLASLDQAPADHEIELVAYAHLNDLLVGARNTAPPDQDPIWSSGTAVFSHFTITTNRRILIDLARRLRGETPIATPSPPPRN